MIVKCIIGAENIFKNLYQFFLLQWDFSSFSSTNFCSFEGVRLINEIRYCAVSTREKFQEDIQRENWELREK